MMEVDLRFTVQIAEPTVENLALLYFVVGRFRVKVQWVGTWI